MNEKKTVQKLNDNAHFIKQPNNYITNAFEKELVHNSKVHPGYQGIMDLIKQKDKINE